MATVKPLRLTREKYQLQGPAATLNPIARVWVDSGVAHLDGTYDYLIPESMSELVSVGVRVSVPFSTRTAEAIVLERVSASQSSATLKKITKVLSPYSVASEGSLKLLARASRHWPSHPFDIIRSAIPPRVATSETLFEKIKAEELVSGPAKRALHRSLKKDGVLAFYSHTPKREALDEISHLALSRLEHGNVLVLVPDEADLDRLEELLLKEIDPRMLAKLGSSLSRADRYLNFLRARFGTAPLVIGTRSAVFAPVSELSTVIVAHESSEQYFEPRTPGWNVKDVALLRREIEGASVIFTGYSPSTEVSALIDAKKAKFLSTSTRIQVSAFAQVSGELLPDRIISPIRKSLESGSVLFLVPRKGYGNALLCGKCRNAAMCECGGRIAVHSAQGDPQCSVCAKKYPQWRCTWCQGNTRYLAARGIDRAAEEIGRAFPKKKVLISSGTLIHKTAPKSAQIVVATPGAVPRRSGGYAAVVLLEGTRFFAGTDLRSQERATEFFFDCAAHVSEGGQVLLSIDPVHPIVAALTRWNPAILAQKYLRERREISFPPFTCSVVIDLDSKEASGIKSGLQRSIDDQRLPMGTRILGPSDVASGKSRLVILSPLVHRESLVSFMLEFTKRRAIAKKPALTIRFDPYSLT